VISSVLGFQTIFASFYYLALIGWVQEGVTSPRPLFEMLMAQHIAAAAPPATRAAPSRSRR
jgi:hypothetical protein